MGERAPCPACKGSEVLWSAVDAAYVDCGCRKRRRARPRPTILTFHGETGKDDCGFGVEVWKIDLGACVPSFITCPAPIPEAP